MTSLKEGSDKGGLRGWFEGGGWDRYDSKGNKIGKCGGRKPGEAKPKCFSKEKAAALGKKGRAQAVRRKRREDPNPNRRGKPIDTPSTKKGLKRRESMSDFTDSIVKKLQEKTKKDACYNKVKASAKVWPSAYASGRLVQCRKKGASNYGKSNSSTDIIGDAILEALKCWNGYKRVKGKTPGTPGSCKKESYEQFGKAIIEALNNLKENNKPPTTKVPGTRTVGGKLGSQGKGKMSSEEFKKAISYTPEEIKANDAYNARTRKLRGRQRSDI